MIEYVLLAFVVILGLILAGQFLSSQVIAPHRMLARDPMAGRDFAKLYKMREVTKKDGSKWWKSFPMNDIVTPAPPPAAIEIMPGGKKYAEGYLISRDQIAWIQDRGLKTKQSKDGVAYEFDYDGASVTLEPFDVTDRGILVQESAQAAMEKGKNFLSPEFVLPALAILGPCAVLIILAIFGPDLVHSWQSQQAISLERDKVQLQTTQAQARITEALGLRVGLLVSQTASGIDGTPTMSTQNENPPPESGIKSII